MNITAAMSQQMLAGLGGWATALGYSVNNSIGSASGDGFVGSGSSTPRLDSYRSTQALDVVGTLLSNPEGGYWSRSTGLVFFSEVSAAIFSGTPENRFETLRGFHYADGTAYYLGDSPSNTGVYSGDGPLFTIADWTNNGIGGLATGMERSGGTFRLSNSKGFSPKHYPTGWRGNGSVTTYNTANWGSRIAKGSLFLNFALGAYSINKANVADGRTFGYNTQVATVKFIGGMAGSMAGAEIGAAIGVWFGGVGAIPGAVVGGVVGGVFGGWGGSELGGAAIKWYY